ncbi:MAG: hypothetical protein KUG68_03270 [Flavobacteriaceae bacterium]|nr:hypothetical protein [Flavobacteriaceae bacterium]
MKKILASLFLISLTLIMSCSDDKSKTCSTCNAPQTTSFELCQESNGNASVNGEDTGVSYAVYLADLETDGTVCGSN